MSYFQMPSDLETVTSEGPNFSILKPFSKEVLLDFYLYSFLSYFAHSGTIEEAKDGLLSKAIAKFPKCAEV